MHLLLGFDLLFFNLFYFYLTFQLHNNNYSVIYFPTDNHWLTENEMQYFQPI